MNLSKHLNNKKKDFFFSIGGIGEIGGNNYLYSFGGEQLIIDAGISFAGDELPGVDISIPDPSYFLDKEIKPKALILTHAHEDHVGGLEYYFDKINFTIYCTEFTFAYIRHKFNRIQNFENKFKIIKPYEEIKFNNFSFSLVPTTHSIPDPCGVFIKSKNGNIYHTGDWKIDPNPVVGKKFDIKNYDILKDQQLDLLVGDSTNANVTTSSRSESELVKSFDKIFRELKGRIVVTCFSSNIARLKTIISTAQSLNKNIFVIGRSVKRAVQTAIEQGLIDNFEIINEKRFKDFKKDNTLLICTGSQGEKNSALMKIATETHNNIKLSKKDNVIFSSKEIPGNEKSISFLKNSFASLGLKIIDDQDEFIHVSGHPSRTEIIELYKYIKPKSFIPMHGEYMHLTAHMEIADNLGINNSIISMSGDLCELDLKEKKHKIIDQYIISKLPIVQSNIILDSLFLNERSKMIFNGAASVNLIINKKLEILDMQIKKKGFPFDDSSELLIEEIKENLLNKLLFLKSDLNESTLNEYLLDLTKKAFGKFYGLKPEIMAHTSII